MWWLLGIFGIGSIVGTIIGASIHRKKWKVWKEKWKEGLTIRRWSPIYSFEDNVKGRAAADKAYSQDVMTMPQLTFDRWRTFYDNKPECWVIQRDETRRWCNIPYYVKINQHKDKYGNVTETVTFLPTYWIDEVELKKYRDWVENDFENGKAKLFSNERDRKLKELTGYISEDLQERRRVFDQELEEAKKQITLRLSDGTEVTVDE